MAHGGSDGRWIRCDPSGHCRWLARTSVAAARLRLFAATRGPLPPDGELRNTCGDRRCVNVDHQRVFPGAGGTDVWRCARGHELTEAGVVRHRDGRIAYCRMCRNERRRDRYRTDPDFARREIERQRQRRA